jgi:hypothetical protein
VNGVAQRVWTTYKLEIMAPAGTDHVVVCLCGLSINGHNESTRFDAVTLKQQL